VTLLEERLDRVESELAIRQLPSRYALAADSRDLDTWVSLFVEDVDCGRHGKPLGNPLRSLSNDVSHRRNLGLLRPKRQHIDPTVWFVGGEIDGP
jgi:SnoaL-like domain